MNIFYDCEILLTPRLHITHNEFGTWVPEKGEVVLNPVNLISLVANFHHIQHSGLWYLFGDQSKENVYLYIGLFAWSDLIAT